MAKFFTSDLHHMHKNIVQYTNRSAETSTENHDEWLIEKWNLQVKNSDTVYVLGDISFSHKAEEVLKFFKRLNGSVIVIKGNHDRTEILNELLVSNAISKWYDYKEIKIQDTNTVLFHFPIACWNKQGRSSWHLHGHSHGNYKATGKILDVGLDNAYLMYNTHRLFTEQDISEHMQNCSTEVFDHHKVIKEL